MFGVYVMGGMVVIGSDVSVCKCVCVGGGGEGVIASEF